jgi:WD40 repeat protein/DNA-binding SARP family transcriptional activator
MARLALSFLGSFQVTLDGQPASGFESNKVRALLAFLAVEADRPHARESLAGLLWPDYPDRSALNSLRSALANLRGAIGDRDAEPPFLLITRTTVRFNEASDHQLDTAELQRAATAPIDGLAFITQLYLGDFLAGFSLSDSPPFEDWLLMRREGFRRQAQDALSRLAVHHEHLGDYECALTLARRGLELEPWDEVAHRLLMRSLALSGRRSLALAQFEICRRALDDELGVAPARETLALYEQICADDLPLPVRDRATALLPEPPAPGEPPFKGLSYFDEADAALFFGREAQTEQLATHVRELVAGQGRYRVVTLIGASGSGKSSVVRAGLVPALRHWSRPDAAGSPAAHPFEKSICVITPGACPLESLAIGLTRGGEPVGSTAALVDDLARDPRSLHLAALRRVVNGATGQLLLVVDQFEELFSLCRDEDGRRAFIDNLLHAAGSPGPVVVVLALRADFYAQCAPYENLRRALTECQAYIGAMNHTELRRAIETPAEQGDWVFEPGLVDLLLREVGDAPGALPLLSHALLETWRRREGRTLTLAGYEASGGVAGALTRTAETAYAQLTGPEKLVARNIFLRLTELDVAGADERLPELYTRRRAPLAELVLHPDSAVQVQTVLTRLADARLITTSRETAEVTHEALIREWPRLDGWLNENREGLRLHRHLTGAAAEWDRLARDPSLLYRGARLAQTGEWAAANAEDLNTLEGAFLAASLAEEQAQQQRELHTAQELAEAERRRAEAEARRAEDQTRAVAGLRRRALSLAVALAAVVGLFFLALWLGQTAGRNARATEAQAQLATSRELAAAAVSNLSNDPELSVILALQALDTADTLEARNALHQTLPELHVERIIPAHSALGAPGVSYSPDGRRLASIGADGFVRVWDVATGERLLELADQPGDYGVDVAYSPDGRLLATTLLGKLIVWDVGTGEQVLKMPGTITGDVDRVDFSPDGTRLAIANLDGRPAIVDLASGAIAYTLEGHETTTEAVSYSPDGRWLATGDNNGVVMVWDNATRREVATFEHKGRIHAVAFSPDGQRLATAGEDGKLTVWDIPDEKMLLSLPTSSGLYDVTFMPDGLRVAGTHQDGATTVWDATTGQLLLTFAGHGSTVISVSAAPDNRHITSSGYDGTLRIWDTAPGRELLTVKAHDSPGYGAVYTPDGAQLVTVGADGWARLWDATTGAPIQTPALDSLAQLESVAVDSNSNRIAVGGSDGRIILFDLAVNGPVMTINAHDGDVWALAFSPDGLRLASSSWDETSKVWDLVTGELIAAVEERCWSMGVTFSPDGERVFSSCSLGSYEWDASTGQVIRTYPMEGLEYYGLALSPDGRLLALGRSDGVVSLWNTTTGEKIRELTGHSGIALGMSFSQDGSLLATSAFDKLAKVWDVATGQELITLYGNGSNIFSTRLSPDARHLATLGGDGTLRLFVLDTAELVSLARTRTSRTLTDEECRRYLHVEQCPVGRSSEVGRPLATAVRH